jgi:hypothetical protein
MSTGYITEASSRRICGSWERRFHPFTDLPAISLDFRFDRFDFIHHERKAYETYD